MSGIVYRVSEVITQQLGGAERMQMPIDEVNGMTPVPGLALGVCGCIPQVGIAPPQCWMRSASDRERLGHACAVLRHYGVVAYPALGPQDAAATSAGIAALMLAVFPDWDGGYLFWTTAEEENCVNSAGEFSRPLLAHVGGPAIEKSVRGALEMVGLAVGPGPVLGTLIVTGR